MPLEGGASRASPGLHPSGVMRSSSRAIGASSSSSGGPGGVPLVASRSSSVDGLSSQHRAGGAVSASLPNASPPLRAMREPVRIASVSPAPYDRNMQAASANGITQHSQPQALPHPQRSPLGGASLAPPTERTRLLLDGFSLHNDEVDALDLVEERGERTMFNGPVSYGSASASTSRNNSCSASPASHSPTGKTGAGTNASRPANSRAFLAFTLPATVILCVGNSVTWKRTLNRFASVDGSQRNLGFFVNEWTLLLYALIAGAFLAYRWLFTDAITPEMRSYPKRRFAIMGGLDAIAGLCAIVGGALTAGQVQIVVQQANIPITMLLSRVYLQVHSYAWSQYIGATVIVAGGLLSAFGTGGDSGVTAHAVWYGPLLILVGILPGSMSNVYKEANFKEQNLDIYYLTVYVAVWQILLSFVCLPLFTLECFGGIAMTDMPRNILEGWACFMGQHIDGYHCEDPAPSTAVILMLYIVVNFAFNMALLSMVKHGSALYLVIALAVALPITNVVFTQHWAMGSDVETLSLYNLLGIVLVVGGFLLYSLVPDASSMPEAVEGEAPEYEYSREFVVPTGASGHSLYITEYLPRVHDPSAPAHERRHSFDFHSSPSVRDAKQARRQRFAKAINRTPSRTP